MIYYHIIKTPLFISPETTLHLSKEQASLREEQLEALEKSGTYRIKKDVCFKVGEVIGFCSAPPKDRLPFLQAVDHRLPEGAFKLNKMKGGKKSA